MNLKIKKFLSILAGFAFFSILISCSPKMNFVVLNDEKIEVEFSTNFSGEFFTILQEFLSSAETATQNPQNESLIQESDLISIFTLAGLKDVSVKRNSDNSISAKGIIEKVNESNFAKSKIIFKEKTSLTISLGPEQFTLFYENLDEESQSYFDLLMIPCLNGEKLSVTEYQELLASLYGEDLAKQFVSEKFSLNLVAPNKKSAGFSITLGELFTLDTQKNWQIKW